MLKLYRFPAATCAAKVLMALHEKGIAFEDVCLDREDLTTDWYRKLNPNGVVPTIEHDGAVIIESSVILTYIADRFAGDGPELRPATPLARAEMHHWLKRLDDLLLSLGTATYAIASRARLLALPLVEREAYFAAIPDAYVRFTRREAVEHGLTSPEVGHALRQLIGLLDLIDAATQDRPCLCGEFSLADISAAPFAARIAALGLSQTGQRPHFDAWWERIQAREAFQIGVEGSTPPPVAAMIRAAAERQAQDIAQAMAS